MDICAAYELGLKDVGAVTETVGQLGIVAEVSAARTQTLSMHGDDVSTLQFVGRKLIIFRTLEVLVVERVAQAKLASSTIHFGIERLVAIDRSQGVGEL